MIQDNAFYLLDIPMTASKQEIAAASERRYLSADDSDSALFEKAANELLNPHSRLQAELGWFPEEDEDTASRIREAVRKGLSIQGNTAGKLADHLSCNGRINVTLYELSLMELSKQSGASDKMISSIASSIEEIGKWIEDISQDELLSAINNKRTAAGITKAGIQDLTYELRERRNSICSELAGILERLPEEQHAKVLGRLADQYVEQYLKEDGKEDGKEDSSVLPECGESEILFCRLADSFEVRTAYINEQLTESLCALLDTFTEKAIIVNAGRLLKEIYAEFDKWLEYNRPLQAAAYLRGSDFKTSMDVVGKCIHAVPAINRKLDWLESYQFLSYLQRNFALVPKTCKEITKIKDQARIYIKRLYRAEPEAAIEKKIKLRERDRIVWPVAIALMLGMFLFAGINILVAPSVEEAANDPSTHIYYDVRRPYQQNSQGFYDELTMPPGGFVFQDTMGEEGRSVTLLISNTGSRDCFIRISDRNYGNKTYISRNNWKEKKEDTSSEASTPTPEEIIKSLYPDSHIGMYEEEAPEGAKILSIMVEDGSEEEVTLIPGDYYISIDRGVKWYGWEFRFNPQPPERMASGIPRYDFPVMTLLSREPYSLQEGSYSIKLND